MPTTRKRPPAKPHPRSLDALFPKPKVRRCTRGHTQTPEWRPMHGCSTCAKENAAMAERALALDAAVQAQRAREREEATAQLQPLPNPYVLRDFYGRVVGVYHAGPRRGPRGRNRIKRRP